MSRQTEVYLVPAAPVTDVVRPEVLLPLASALRFSRFNEVLHSRFPQRWDRTNPFDSVHDVDLTTEDLMESFHGRGKLGKNKIRWLSANAIEGAAPLEQMIETLKSHPDMAHDWSPFYYQLNLGVHTLPDNEHERTVWSGEISVSFYGDGNLIDQDRFTEVLTKDPVWGGYAQAMANCLGVQTRYVAVFYG